MSTALRKLGAIGKVPGANMPRYWSNAERCLPDVITRTWADVCAATQFPLDRLAFGCVMAYVIHNPRGMYTESERSTDSLGGEEGTVPDADDQARGGGLSRLG